MTLDTTFSLTMRVGTHLREFYDVVTVLERVTYSES